MKQTRHAHTCTRMIIQQRIYLQELVQGGESEPWEEDEAEEEG